MKDTHGSSGPIEPAAEQPLSPAQLEAWIAGSGFFDPSWYLEQYPDVARSAVNPLAHFIMHGGGEGRHPSPHFDSRFYLNSNPDVRAAGLNPLVHYLTYGSKEGRPTRAVPLSQMEAVVSSGLFDPEWYRERYPDVATGGWDPLTHFIWHGAAEDRNPGPLFDSQFYRDSYADIATTGVVPLYHYLSHGREEGRITMRPACPDSPFRPVLPRSFAPPPPFRLACVVHAYYPELFAEIAPLLLNLPRNFALYIAVPSLEGRAVVCEALAHHHIPARVEVRVVPNRGRNFGSFLCEFSGEMGKHDLVLHLHTKKSLYSGEERNSWRRSLYRGLLGSREVVHLILNSFASFPDLGLSYPAAFGDMPYWAHHWLRNVGQARGLLGRLGFDSSVTSGYVDYPVGGMFWARVDALRPLFDAGLKYEDFNEEIGQTDGTLAHAIERVVGVIAAARGYRFAEFDYDQGVLRSNWSARNLEQYLRVTTRAAFEQKLLQADVVSFDIFDTLLTRPARRPDSILRYVDWCLSRSVEPLSAFFESRKRAEELARRAKNCEGDVDLSEIYTQIGSVSGWSTAQIERARELECAIDARVLCPRESVKELVALARRHGRRIIAISDTYYPMTYLKSRLDESGYEGLIDEIYASSHEQARKDRGDLWSRVAEQERLAAERWLHVGDDEQSDIQATCDRGVPFIHVMKPSTLVDAIDARRQTGPRPWADDLLLGPAILALGADPFVTRASFARAPLASEADVGFVVFGPLLYRFTAWLVSHAALTQVPHVFFLSREGMLLQRVYEMIRERYPDLKLPPSSYFHASRRVLLSAVQGVRFSPELILEGAGYSGDMASLLRSRVGLEVPEEYGLSRWTINLPDDHEYVLKAVLALKEPIVVHGTRELGALREYCAQMGMTGSFPGAVVDIGYSATIQKCLQLVQDASLLGLYFATSRAARAVEQNGGYAYGCFAEDFVTTHEHGPVVQHSLLLESFLTAPHGQVVGFRQEAHTVRPVFKEQVLPATTLSTLARLHEGALAYCEKLLDVYGPDLLCAEMSCEAPQRFLNMLLDESISIPEAVIDALHVEDDFCGKGVVSIARNSLPGSSQRVSTARNALQTQS